MYDDIFYKRKYMHPNSIKINYTYYILKILETQYVTKIAENAFSISAI